MKNARLFCALVLILVVGAAACNDATPTAFDPGSAPVRSTYLGSGYGPPPDSTNSPQPDSTQQTN